MTTPPVRRAEAAHRTCSTPAAMSFCSLALMSGSCIAALAFFGSVCISCRKGVRDRVRVGSRVRGYGLGLGLG